MNEYIEDIEAKIVRLYITKGYSLSVFQNLGICGSDKASEILNRYGLLKHKGDFRLDGKYNKLTIANRY